MTDLFQPLILFVTLRLQRGPKHQIISGKGAKARMGRFTIENHQSCAL